MGIEGGLEFGLIVQVHQALQPGFVVFEGSSEAKPGLGD
jgi:hypothetical protein